MENYQYIEMTKTYADIIKSWNYDGFIKSIDMSAYFENVNSLTGKMKGPLNCDGYVVLKNSIIMGLFECYLKEEGFIEIGLALNPELVGKGQSKSFILNGIEFIQEHYNYLKSYILLTVDIQNENAYFAYLKAGFIEDTRNENEVVMKYYLDDRWKMIQNKSSYNRIASRWSQLREHSSLNPYEIQFASLVQRNGSILDIGCGTGYPIDTFLSKQGFSIIGIDFSEEMIQIASNQSIANTVFQMTDIFDYIPPHKFDGIIAFDSLFHISKQKQKDIYPLVSDWLVPGGVFMFTHGKTDGEINSQMFQEEFHYSALDLSSLKEEIKKNGFLLKEVVEDYKDKKEQRDLIVIAIKQ